MKDIDVSMLTEENQQQFESNKRSIYWFLGLIADKTEEEKDAALEMLYAILAYSKASGVQDTINLLDQCKGVIPTHTYATLRNALVEIKAVCLGKYDPPEDADV